MELSTNEKCAENGYQSYRHERGCDHGESLGEGKRMEHFAFHVGEREHGDERQNDDDHGEKDWPAPHFGCIERDLPDMWAIVAMLLGEFLRLPENVLRHHDSRIDQHTNSDCDSSQRHDVGGNPDSFHEEKGAQDRQRKRQSDDQNAAEVPQKNDVGQRNQDDFFDQCVAQRIDRMVDERTAVVKRNYGDSSGQPGLQGSQLLFDGLDDFQWVRAVAADNYPTDGFLAAIVEYPATELRS